MTVINYISSRVFSFVSSHVLSFLHLSANLILSLFGTPRPFSLIHLSKPKSLIYKHFHQHNFGMDKNKKKKIVSASSSSSFDHIFGPRVSSSSSSSATGLFKSIFPPPSADQLGRQVDFASQGGHVKYQSPNERGERSNKKEKKSCYNEETEPPCHLSSSLYYGGQEKYSSTTTTTHDTTYKKDGEEGDSKSASRGNWWEGSLYY